MIETIVHFTVEVVHEGVGLSRCLLLKVLQEVVRHVCALSQHVIEVAKALLARLLLVLDVCVHLVAFSIYVCHDLLLVRNPSFLFFNETFCDSFDLSSDWVKSLVMVLDSVFLFLDDCSFKFIPTLKSVSLGDLF